MESNAVRVDASSNADAFTRDDLRESGFEGFVNFRKLREGAIGMVPDVRGIYVVLRWAEDAPMFLEASAGGRFKGKDPTVDIAILQAKWIGDASCLYIGKATDLRRRLRQYMRFGSGSPIGHWGGRYIWQLDGSENLIVAWKETGKIEPRDAEIELLASFTDAFDDHLPFANLIG